MIDFLVQNSVYVVLIIATMIWLGIGSFLSVIDKKISKLEKITNLNSESRSNEI